MDCTNNSVLGICQACSKDKDWLSHKCFKIRRFFNTNISLALLRRLRPNTLRCTLLCTTRSLENVVFFSSSAKIRTIKCRTKTIHNSIGTSWLHYNIIDNYGYNIISMPSCVVFIILCINILNFMYHVFLK